TTAVGEDTFLAEVGRLVTDAELAQVPLRQLADRIASVFAPVVLALALIAAVGWGLLGHAPIGVSVLVFVSVAITACPCAFGIATPAAIVVAVGRGAQEGVLFKGRDAIEKAARVDLALFDKTGTLTLGRPALVDSLAAPGRSSEEVLALAAGLEVGSSHPLAGAIARESTLREVRPAPVEALRAEIGQGVAGRLAGSEVSILRWDGASSAPRAPPEWTERLERWSNSGYTVSLLRVGHDAVGALAFSDTLATGAPEAVRELAAAGIRSVMVTGDSEGAAARIAAAVGIAEVHARCTPARKLEILRELQQQHHRVAFAGDGINDAPALAAADLGVAVGTGLDVAKEAGQLLLLGDDLRGIPLAVALARGTLR
ncbi:MAG: HAD-IC family P-type ATPase, partial [Thermoplasmata archaeon]